MSSEPALNDPAANHAAAAERVLFVGSYASHRAAAAPSEEIASRLEGLGHHVVVASKRHGAFSKLLDVMTVIAALRPLPDVAHVDLFSGRAFFLAEVATRLLARQRIPTIVTLHGGGLLELAEHSPRRVARVLDGATAVTAPSRYLQNALARFRRDIQLIPNPIELSRYRQIPERRPGTLLWLRAFHKTYNPRLAVEALGQLRREPMCSELGQTMTLLMVGPDKGDGSRRQTEKRVRSLELEDSVELRGGVEKSAVPEVLLEGDVFLNTSNVDNTPVTVLEAMASGLPVVSTDVGGTSSLLEDGELGVLVPANDPGAMARAVATVAADQSATLARVRRARRAVEAFDWGQVLPKWQQLIRTTAGAAAPNEAQRGLP